MLEEQVRHNRMIRMKPSHWVLLCLVHTNKHNNCTNAQSSKLLFTSQQGQVLAKLPARTNGEQHNTCVQVLDGLPTCIWLKLLHLHLASDSLESKCQESLVWHSLSYIFLIHWQISCIWFFVTFWKCHFYFGSWIFLQVAAPAANAALLAGLVANLSTETVPVRGSVTGEHLMCTRVYSAQCIGTLSTEISWNASCDSIKLGS